MKLYGKSRDIQIVYTFAAAVIKIIKAQISIIRQGIAGYFIAMVLAGDI